MAASREEIISILDNYLDVQGIRDYGPMGLQVVGKAEVSRVAVAVSASLACFAQAAAQQADMLIVHHGLFWENESRVVGHVMRGRLRALFHHDMSLLAYHLCLDKHPEIGNNVLGLKALGATPVELDSPLGLVGYVGEFSPPLLWEELTNRVRSAFGGKPFFFSEGAALTSRLGLVTGGAGRPSYIIEAAERGCDTFLTGELSESAPAVAAELSINLIGAGHYNTEKLGVQAIARLLEDRFGVSTVFVDVPNPL